MSELTVGTLSGLAANGYVIDVASGSKLVQPGSVLQVVSTTKTDTFGTSSTTYVDVTGLSATITPTSASSKILVSVTLHAQPSNNRDASGLVLRDSTPIGVGDTSGSRTSATFDLNQAYAGSANLTDDISVNHQMQILDTPATTSATTYKVQIKRGTTVASTTVYVNRSNDDADNGGSHRTASTITLMEIAG